MNNEKKSYELKHCFDHAYLIYIKIRIKLNIKYYVDAFYLNNFKSES